MLNKKANKLLVKTEKAITDKVAPEHRKAFDRIVLAGTKAMFSEKMHPALLQQMRQPGDPAENAGEGVAKLFSVLMNQSKGTMPMQAGIPAMAVLVLEALDMLEGLGKIKVDESAVERSQMSLSSSLLQWLGVKPERMNALMKKASQPPAQPAPKPEQPAPQQPAGPQPLIGAPA